MDAPKMKRLFSLLTMAFALVLFAQGPAQAQGRSADARVFARMATIGNNFEILSSELALSRSNNAAVRDFASQMVSDHGMVGQQMTALKMQVFGPGPSASLPSSPLFGVNALIVPVQASASSGLLLDGRHRAMLARLRSAPPALFDREYMRSQLLAHRENIALFAAYARSGRHPAFRAFAAENLPTLRQHYAHARMIAGQAR
jgi:putative membrane protein